MGYQPNPNELLGFHIAEGFARITCNGHTDVYLVLNRVPLGAYTLSVAYAMDDFADDMNGVGHTFFVKETDEIEHLGGARDYFAPISTVEPWKAAVVRLFEQSIGLLPIVRACEKLRTFGRAPTVEEIRQAAQESLADYQVRRLMRGVGVRGHH
jgi:hypothetical protein